MALFKAWCAGTKDKSKKKTFRTYSGCDDHDEKAAARAAAQTPIHGTDLRVPGQSESRSLPVRRASCANVWRGRGCGNPDSAHAPSLHGGGSGDSKGECTPSCHPHTLWGKLLPYASDSHFRWEACMDKTTFPEVQLQRPRQGPWAKLANTAKSVLQQALVLVEPWQNQRKIVPMPTLACTPGSAPQVRRRCARPTEHGSWVESPPASIPGWHRAVIWELCLESIPH